MRIDQFLPSFASRDAIGSHVLNTREALRQAGFESDIWAEEIRPPLQDEARHVESYPGSGGRADVVVYHASGHSRMAGFFAGRPETLVVDYHNITPSRFLARWDPVGAANVDLGRLEVRRLAPITALALADSGYNEAELVDAGFRRTAVSPILHDYDRSQSDPDPRVLADLERSRESGGARWLFVGRLAPNKCQHDLIGAFAVYRRLIDPKASLTLVGATTAPRYDQALRGLIADLGVGDAVDLPGSISLGHLLAIYRTTDVLVCLSEHEGFCVPIVEAMARGVPVVAYAAAAVGETVGDAGVLLADKDPLLVACAVERVVTDGGLRSELVVAGQARVQCFALDRTAKQMVGHLSACADGV